MEQVLCKVAKPYKDEVIFVGSESGNGRSKKGDLLIEINPGDVDGKKARIVIEAKRDASKSIRGKTGILIEIEDAKANRQADFAIAVYSRDACPSEVGQLRDYGNNRLVCSIPADGSEPLVLEVAYILARTEVCWQKRHQSGRFDRAQARQVLHSIQEKLDRFQGIKTKATNISNLADDLRKDLANVEKEIRECVELALRELEVDSAS